MTVCRERSLQVLYDTSGSLKYITLLLKLQPGARFQKVLQNFQAQKPFVKLQPAYFVKLVFSNVVKRINIKITVKLHALRCRHFEDTKRIMSPAMCPKSFRTFEKWAQAGSQVSPMRKE